MTRFLLLAATCMLSATGARLRVAYNGTSSPSTMYKNDCSTHQARTHALALLTKVPGAGMNPETLKPYTDVFMDGYMHVICTKDSIFEFGDRFGKNKFSYNIEDRYNVSIVRYTEIVAKEDRKPMNHEVCFKFCRTLPDMKFFGIAHGRDCYCSPFFQPAASDSSNCDQVCEGNPTQMCGGKVKSSMFAMHLCQDTAEELESFLYTAHKWSAHAKFIDTGAKHVYNGMQDLAVKKQNLFGKAGDPVAADLMQTTKVWAGKLQHANEDLQAEFTDIRTDITDGWALLDSKDGFKTSVAVTAAEKLMDHLKGDAVDVKAKFLATKTIYDASMRGGGGSGRKAEYYPLMYFVDKEFQHVPSTCGGHWDQKTIYGVSVDECAAACDHEVWEPECVGFSYYEGSLCMLFSKFESVTYYTGCGDAGVADDTKLSLLHNDVAGNGAASSDFVSLNFSSATLTTNNLNGKGPGTGASELMYTNVGEYKGAPIDLVVTSDAAYEPQTGEASKLKGLLASITFGCMVNSVITFTFQQNGAAVELPMFDVTIFDFDTTSTSSIIEEVNINGFDAMHMDEDQQFIVATQADGSTSFSSTEAGSGCDNPSNPDALTTVNCNGNTVNQEARSVGFRFSKKSSIALTVNMAGANPKNCDSSKGRFLLFGFKSLLSPAPPAPKVTEANATTAETKAAFAKCYAKLEDFVGTDLNPDLASAKSGKNKLSLKKATKADRCIAFDEK